jgi:hypothetical protein
MKSTEMSQLSGLHWQCRRNMRGKEMSSIMEMIEADKALARSLEGTYLFDGARAQRNYPLNKQDVHVTDAVGE